MAVGVGLLSNPKEGTADNIVESMIVKDYAEKFVEEIIKSDYEPSDGRFKIVENKIISLERVASFDELLPTAVELWSIEYRLKPDDINKVVMAGGMQEIDGWITENGSMGKPLLAFTYEGDTKYLGPVYTGEFNMTSLAGQEIAIRKMLESKGILPNETYKGNHIVIKFPSSSGDTCQVLLSQPVVQGSKGIWAVERWMDGNGTIYYEYPQTDLKIRDYYEDLQAQFDKGENLELGDPKEVGFNFIRNGLGQIWVKVRELEVKNPATLEEFLETPISHYIAYITKFELDDPIIHIDRIEWLNDIDDVERLKELEIDADTLNNGYYIYNPTSYPEGLFLGKDTEYNLINPENVTSKVVSKSEFHQYLQDATHDPIFHIYTRDGDITIIQEQYRP